MSSTLSEGVRVPDIGSVNWGADVNYNWGLLNTALANISGNVKTDAENTWTAPQTFTETISGSIDGVATRAVGDEDGNNIKTALAGKQPSLSQSQLDACNSGITASAVQQIGTNADNISGLQTAVASKAADDSVVHLAGAETITGDKTFTGAVATHNITPETNGTYSLGSSSYQWASVYAQTYYYNGTAWGLDKENAWSNINTYQREICISGDRSAYIAPMWESASSGIAFLNSDASKTFIFGQYTTDANNRKVPDGTKGRILIRAGERNGETVVELESRATNATLGTSINKWKTLNGINPGALSLPANSYVAIDTTNFNKSGGLNTYTPPSNGWVGIQAASVSYNASYYVFIGRFTDGTTANPSYWSQGQVSPLMANFDGYIGQVFIPVIGGKLYHIRINGDFSTGGSIKAYFFPCLGNV